MIGTDFVTTYFAPMIRQELGAVPLHVMVGRANTLYFMFGSRWPSEN